MLFGYREGRDDDDFGSGEMMMITCPEALMGLSAMVFNIIPSRDYPTSA